MKVQYAMLMYLDALSLQTTDCSFYDQLQDISGDEPCAHRRHGKVYQTHQRS